MNKWYNKYGARIINPKGHTVAQKKLKDLDMDDLKLWKKDETK